MHFSEGDLGTPLAADKVPAHLQPLMKAASKTAAPVTPDISAPAKAVRKSLQPSTPAGAAKSNKQAPGACQATPDAARRQPAATDSTQSRPAASEQQCAGSQQAQPQTASAAQDSRSQEQVAAASKPEEAPLKRPLAEVFSGQSVGQGTGQAGSAAKKQKRIVPTAMTSAPSLSLPATIGECCACLEYDSMLGMGCCAVFMRLTQNLLLAFFHQSVSKLLIPKISVNRAG